MAAAATAAFDVLKTGSDFVQVIHNGLQNNRLGRKTLGSLLRQYYMLAPSDGRLIDAARQHGNCAYYAFHLLIAHADLANWLADNNFKRGSTSVKWYSYKKLFKNNRIPFFLANARTRELQAKLDHIETLGHRVLADMEYHENSSPGAVPEELYGNMPRVAHAQPPPLDFQSIQTAAMTGFNQLN